MASSEACREAEAMAPLPWAMETCPGALAVMVTLKSLYLFVNLDPFACALQCRTLPFFSSDREPRSWSFAHHPAMGAAGLRPGGQGAAPGAILRQAPRQ